MRVSVLHRVFAKTIDFAGVVCFAKLLPYPLGPLVGLLYSIGSDALKLGSGKSQSLGKKLLKLQTVSRVRGTDGLRAPCNLKESVFRNAPIWVATLFAFIPVWGWVIMFLIGVPLMGMEIYLMLTVDTGHRLGDVMGDTEVISSNAA